jgi:RISC-loading complex subunit TARBP2
MVKNEMSSKTPVSILQEMCIRKGDVPQYELIHDGGGSHEALFKYRVVVGESSAIGSGRSKKEAKHDAAQCLLNRLNAQGITLASDPDTVDMLDVSDITSPYKGMLQENAVGALQELCMLNDIPVPEYTVTGDEGPPHAKQFTMMCQVSKLTESAIARTKKQAKQLAAFKMLNMLRTSLADVLTSTSGDKGDALSEKSDMGDPYADIAVSKYKELGTIASNTRKVIIGQKISEYHLMQKSLQGTLLNRLKTNDEELKKEAAIDPMDVLQRIMEELNLDSDLTGIESDTPDQYIILLSMSTSPESVTFGIAATQEGACKIAAENALEHLKIMTA